MLRLAFCTVLSDIPASAAAFTMSSLTQTERLTMTGRPKDPKTARNKNVLVIGGSGSGKTRFYVKPNLMQCFPTSDYPTSFVVTDPKGTLVLETGQMFQRAGYRVKILNTINFSNLGSM